MAILNSLELEAFNKIKQLSEQHNLNINDETIFDWIEKSYATIMRDPETMAHSIKSVLEQFESR